MCTTASTLSRILYNSNLGKEIWEKNTWVPGNKYGPVRYEARLPTMRCFFHLRFLSHGWLVFVFCNHFWSSEWIWQCSGTTVTIAKLLSFFKRYLYLLHGFSPSKYWWQMSEAKTRTNGKTIKSEYHLVLSDTVKHFSAQ